MKKIIYLLYTLTLASCSHSNSNTGQNIIPDTVSDIPVNVQNVAVSNTTKHENNDMINPIEGFEKATLYKLSDTIYADFNGDGILDKAFFKKEKATSGIIIIHGRTQEEFRIGFGKPFAHLTELNWVDYWGLVEDNETNETIFTKDGDVEGGQKVLLQNPSIIIGANEIGGGLITYKNGKYQWIHQTC